MFQISNEDQQVEGQQTEGTADSNGDRIYKRKLFDKQWHRLVVIKISQQVTSDSAQTKFQNQHRETLIAKIQHEFEMQNEMGSNFIIQNYDMQMLSDSVVLIQQDFDTWLSKMPIRNLDFKHRLQIMMSLALGVQILEDNSVCHRALSPLSVGISKVGDEYIAKINNFDLSVRCNATKNSFIDTSFRSNKKIKLFYSYVAPQLKNQFPYSFKSDVWSLGMLFNYLMYETTENVVESSNRYYVHMPDETPRWIKELLTKMLDFQQQKRPTIETVIKILKVSIKCVDIMNKFVPLGNRLIDMPVRKQ